jgi:hypothetical protein
MRIIELFEDLPNTPGLTPAINTSGIAPANAAPTANTTGTSPAKPVIAPSLNQQLSTQGSTIQVPTGPGKAPTNFKVSAVDSKTGNVTLVNPQNPGQPGLTYTKDQLAQAMAQDKAGM